MEINISMEGDVVIMDASGDLVASTAEVFKSQVAKLREKNFNFILADMSKVGFMDSSGLGACMAVHKSVAEKGGKIVWAKLGDAVGKLFRITKADQKLAVAATRQDGIKAVLDAIVAGRK